MDGLNEAVFPHPLRKTSRVLIKIIRKEQISLVFFNGSILVVYAMQPGHHGMVKTVGVEVDDES
jgi:hypothetical protein